MSFEIHNTASSACTAVLLALASFSVHAQGAPAAATTTSTSAVAIPPAQCEKPPAGPMIDPTSAQTKRFQKQVGDYKSCVDEYAKAMGAKSNEHAELARAYESAANSAIDSYNTYVTDLNARAKGGSGDPKQESSPSSSKPKY